jgi:hypothetical protein
MSYVGEVANAFLSRRSGPGILRPMDYAIIAEWEKQEIPLAVVVDSINEGCGKIECRIDEIDSIGSFQDLVRKNFRVWLESGQPGASRGILKISGSGLEASGG